MKAFFFDMDGVLFDSMPLHAKAWEEVMSRHGLPFSAYDTYVNEGRTGESVIDESFMTARHRHATPQEIQTIYNEKTLLFHQEGDAKPIKGVDKVLQYVQAQGYQIWIVTGSAQESLFDKLDTCFPHIFCREHMITASDVKHGKPDPEPYLKAWERSGLPKKDCIVIENAPMGVESGKAAGLTVYAVNTGILTPQDLQQAGADKVVNDMQQLLVLIKNEELGLIDISCT